MLPFPKRPDAAFPTRDHSTTYQYQPMILIKPLLALVSIAAGLFVTIMVWKKFQFFVPRRDSWTKSPLDQLSFRFGKSVSWGIGCGLLIYILADVYLEDHFPAYKKYGIKNTANEPVITATRDSIPVDAKSDQQESPKPSSALPPPAEIRTHPLEHPQTASHDGNSKSGPILDTADSSPSRPSPEPAEIVHPANDLPHLQTGTADNRSLATNAANDKHAGEINVGPVKMPSATHLAPTPQADLLAQNGHARAEPVAMIGERYPETRVEKLDESFTRSLGDSQLRYAINEMFARHGAVFPQQEINRVFDPMPWYRPDSRLSFDQIETQRFTDLEKTNLKILGTARDERKRKAQGAVQEISRPQPAKDVRVRFVDSEGNLRSGPGTGFPVIRTPSKGEQASIERRSGRWIMLRFDSGETGWANEKNLEP